MRLPSYEIPAEHRQRRSHQRSGYQQDDCTDDESQEAERVERCLKILIDEAEERLRSSNKNGQDNGVDADEQLQDAIDSQRIGGFVNEPPRQKTTQRQSTHEGGENGGYCKHRISDNKGE